MTFAKIYFNKADIISCNPCCFKEQMKLVFWYWVMWYRWQCFIQVILSTVQVILSTSCLPCNFVYHLFTRWFCLPCIYYQLILSTVCLQDRESESVQNTLGSMDRRYQELLELAKLRKQRLLDALSLYKLFNEADSVVTWIDEKVRQFSVPLVINMSQSESCYIVYWMKWIFTSIFSLESEISCKMDFWYPKNLLKQVYSNSYKFKIEKLLVPVMKPMGYGT